MISGVLWLNVEIVEKSQTRNESLLPPCPNTPNCVCSDDDSTVHQIEPYRLTVPPERAWSELQTVLSAIPRVRIVEATASRLRAEFRSRLFRFVDDVELQLRADVGIIAVRSASRVGYSDLGVNRRRVEDLRAQLRARGLIS